MKTTMNKNEQHKIYLHLDNKAYINYTHKKYSDLCHTNFLLHIEIPTFDKFLENFINVRQEIIERE